MNRGEFKDAPNRRVLEAGTDGELHILDIDGVMISCWYPSPDEIRALIAGRPLQLHIVGNRHPWVRLVVEE